MTLFELCRYQTNFRHYISNDDYDEAFKLYDSLISESLNTAPVNVLKEWDKTVNSWRDTLMHVTCIVTIYLKNKTISMELKPWDYRFNSFAMFSYVKHKLNLRGQNNVKTITYKAA